MNNKSRNLNTPIMSLKDEFAQMLEDAYSRQSRLSCTPSEYKEIQGELIT